MTDDTAIPYGSDVSAGTFVCNDCDQKITLGSSTSIPPCPDYDEASHPEKSWRALSGRGDAVDDPASG